MRAGSLDTAITIQRPTNTVNAAGTPVIVWTDYAFLRAAIIQDSVEEFIRSGGARDVIATVFRTRYREGITTADRVLCDDVIHNIRELKELGRRQGLEIRTVSSGEMLPEPEDEP